MPSGSISRDAFAHNERTRLLSSSSSSTATTTTTTATTRSPSSRFRRGAIVVVVGIVAVVSIISIPISSSETGPIPMIATTTATTAAGDVLEAGRYDDLLERWESWKEDPVGAPKGTTSSSREAANQGIDDWYRRQSERWIKREWRKYKNRAAGWFRRRSERWFQKELRKRRGGTSPPLRRAASVAAARVVTAGGSAATTTTTTKLSYLNSSGAYGMLSVTAAAAGGGGPSFSTSFYALQWGWDVQMTQAHCAVASVAAVLNSLRLARPPLPVDPTYSPYRYATQRDIMTGHDGCVNDNVIRVGVDNDGGGGGGSAASYDGIWRAPGGLTLGQAEKLLRCNLNRGGKDDDDEVDVNVDVVLRRADPNTTTAEVMRDELKAALSDPSSRVVVNYRRSEMGQVGGGHFSPLGGYDEASDSFLIMDVAKYKYPPVWVKSDDLFRSLSTVDQCGTWDYPASQDELTGASTRLGRPTTPEDYADAMRIVGCRPRYRGYLVVRMRGGDDIKEPSNHRE